MKHSKHQIFKQTTLQIPISYWYIQLSLKEFMEFLPLLPSDDPANKQPVEVSATILSRKTKIIKIKNKITHNLFIRYVIKIWLINQQD